MKAKVSKKAILKQGSLSSRQVFYLEFHGNFAETARHRVAYPIADRTA